MENIFKIAVLGIGGVGGYFGGKLAGHYANTDTIEVLFIARGKNAEAISTKGLKIITNNGEEIVRPTVISNVEQLPQIDLLLCCVKSYDLTESLSTLKNAVSSKTIIIPFLNGVDAPEKIKQLFPQATIYEGCAYIVSRLTEPGVIKENGNSPYLCFGEADESSERLNHIKNIFVTAGIKTQVPANIALVIWEKYLFISSLATLSSALNLCLGAILENRVHKETLRQLMEELRAVASAKGIILPENSSQLALDKMMKLPYGTDPSMYSDLKKGHKCELEGLTTYIINLGKELNVPTPCFENSLNEIKRIWLS